MPETNETPVDELFPSVYEELREVAERWMLAERPGHTLQPTALVHEAYLRMLEQPDDAFQDHAHLVATAVTALRRILVDHARGRGCEKRGGGRARVPLDDSWMIGEGGWLADETDCDLITLDAALRRLEAHDADKAAVVELRFFGGLTTEEASRVLSITTRSVERRWEYARAWLFREMNRGIGDD